MTLCAQAETKLSPVKSVAARQTMDSPGVYQLMFPLLRYVFFGFGSTRYDVCYLHLSNISNLYIYVYISQVKLSTRPCPRGVFTS